MKRLIDERGGVLVMVTVWLPVVILFFMFVLETGNWFVHKRHLQAQADAAVLAGGAMFSECFGGNGDTAIFTEASKYAGRAGSWQGTTYGAQLHNGQIGGANQGSVSVLYQSKTHASGGPLPDDTETEAPCSTPSLMFDVKATEAGLPLFFGNFIPGFTSATVNAHARVQLRTVETMKGLLPIAVPDSRFNYAFATFVNEATGGTLATAQLQKAGTSGGQQLWSSASNVNVPISSPHVGVRIRLVGGTDPNASCGQLYVECHDAESANGAVAHIRGWNPSASTPDVRDAWLLQGTCTPDAYFAANDCIAGVQANVDLGPRYPLGGTGVTTEVWASVDGSGKHSLVPGGTSGTVTWTLGSGLPITGGGPHDVSLAWSWEKTAGTWEGKTCTTKNNNPCKAQGSFGVVQRAFVASPERSGSLQSVQLSNGAFSSGANSFAYGTASLGVTIAVTGSLSVQSAATDPVVKLRVVGSQNQSIDCDPAKSNLRDEIATGCEPSYAINTSLACPDYNALWGQPQPWPCVKTQTGGSVGQVSQGLKDRILGGSNSCTAPNHWPNYSPDDPRIVPLIITPFGSFGGSGNDIVPVIDFGAFYVVGWGGPDPDPCPGSEPVPKGYIAGHFIKYVPPNSTATGDEVCDPKAVTPCVPVLTH